MEYLLNLPNKNGFQGWCHSIQTINDLSTNLFSSAQLEAIHQTNSDYRIVHGDLSGEFVCTNTLFNNIFITFGCLYSLQALLASQISFPYNIGKYIKCNYTNTSTYLTNNSNLPILIANNTSCDSINCIYIITCK
jgi:hypothetical protein